MMKRIIATISGIILCVCAFTQAPGSFSYQAIVRGASGEPIVTQAVSYRFSIIKSTIGGTVVYEEKHGVTTNQFGLVTLAIGNGTNKTGDLSTIDWGADSYFLKVEIDATGGTSYTDMGTTQLLSVPYALQAKSASSYSETDPKIGTNTTDYLTKWDGNQVVGSSIFDNGSIGIGTATPSAPLEVINSTSFQNLILAGYATSTNRLRLSSGNTSAVISAGDAYDINKGIVIDHTTGNVGIGKGSASSKLDVNGEIITLGGNSGDWSTAFGWGDHALAGYVAGSRSITINGTALDLTTDRSWSVGTVTSVALSLPNIFSLSGSPVTAAGTLTATFASQTANQVFASPSASAGAPTFRTLVSADIPNLDWSKITTGKPTTLAGYGITNAVGTTGNQTIAGNKTFTGTTTVNAPVNQTDAATKEYIDNIMKAMNIIPSNYAGMTYDIDGNPYTTVTIGTQTWMVQNLKTTRYKNGTAIPLVTNNTTWANLTTPGYCWYDHNEAAYKDTYGALYNWYTVNTGNLCPTGWHVPSDAEWTTLTDYLGGESVAGGKLKEIGITHWITPNTGATNEVGFSALPGGNRGLDGTIWFLGSEGEWWSSTELDALDGIFRGMGNSSKSVIRNSYRKKVGFSIRCLKD